MVSLSFIFFILVLIFGTIGAMRGWAKEMLVSFGIILSMFILSVLQNLPPIRDTVGIEGSNSKFWLQTIVIIVLAFFAYQTPNLPRLGGARFARERLADILLGFLMGIINGYLIIGTLWYYLDQAGYRPLQTYFTAPTSDAVLRLLTYMAPHWMGAGSLLLYFTVALAFLFVIVVFI
jgi:uncharacterized membrane protein required for colicin V production